MKSSLITLPEWSSKHFWGYLGVFKAMASTLVDLLSHLGHVFERREQKVDQEEQLTIARLFPCADAFRLYFFAGSIFFSKCIIASSSELEQNGLTTISTQT